MLLVIALFHKICFDFTRLLQESFLLRTDSSKAEHLAVGGGCFVMSRMATVHVQILVLVCGFDTQVGLSMAVLQVDHCVEEGYLFGRPVGSKFNSRVVMFKTFNEHTQRWFAMGPYSKDVVCILPPYLRCIFLGM